MKYFHRTIFVLATLFLAVLLFYVFINAGEYYSLPLTERPHHPAHSAWKPGGISGHGLGIIGTLMIMIMLTYSLRKRIHLVRRLGKLTTWLNYHIFLGIAAPILITFHTALKFGGLVSIAYWSMAAVALSGFIGRYIYVKIPRHITGEERGLQEVDNELVLLKEELKSQYGLDDDDFSGLDRIAGLKKIKRRGLRAVFTFLTMDITYLFYINPSIRPLVKKARITGQKQRYFRRTVKKVITLSRRIAFLNSAQRLFHYWHIIHRPFAYTMIVIIVIHVYIAVKYGYRWIF